MGKISAICLLCFYIIKIGLAEETITIIASNSLRPYIYEEEGEVKGTQAKILTTVFSNMSHQVKFLLMPNDRIFYEFKKEKYHASLNLPVSFFSEHGDLYPSVPVDNFQNCAISKKSKGLKIKKISDLVKFKVGGFQSASKIYPELQKIENYQEVEHQGSLAHLLIKDRIEFAISEFSVFKDLYRSQGQDPMDVECSFLVETVGRYLSFKDKKLRDRFNTYFKAYQEK
ncbi:MAG: hypothetical protein H6622_02410 [Halobacteriovoraceae bacterium]|nr:hypothetical protein [Halobacteriovoraceae bacterium]